MNSRHGINSQRAFQTAKKLVHLHPGTDTALLTYCFYYRVTRYVVNDFKWQINYVRANKYLLSCYQHLGKFNAIMCAKYHNRPLFT